MSFAVFNEEARNLGFAGEQALVRRDDSCRQCFLIATPRRLGSRQHLGAVETPTFLLEYIIARNGSDATRVNIGQSRPCARQLVRRPSVNRVWRLRLGIDWRDTFHEVRQACCIFQIRGFHRLLLGGAAGRRITSADTGPYGKFFTRSRQYPGRRCWWPTARTSNSSGNGA